MFRHLQDFKRRVAFEQNHLPTTVARWKSEMFDQLGLSFKRDFSHVPSGVKFPMNLLS